MLATSFLKNFHPSIQTFENSIVRVLVKYKIEKICHSVFNKSHSAYKMNFTENYREEREREREREGGGGRGREGEREGGREREERECDSMSFKFLSHSFAWRAIKNTHYGNHLNAFQLSRDLCNIPELSVDTSRTIFHVADQNQTRLFF